MSSICNPFANPGQHNAEYNVGHTEHWRTDEGQFPKDLTKDSTRNSYADGGVGIGETLEKPMRSTCAEHTPVLKRTPNLHMQNFKRYTEKHPWELQKSSLNRPRTPWERKGRQSLPTRLLKTEVGGVGPPARACKRDPKGASKPTLAHQKQAPKAIHEGNDYN